VLKRGAQGCVAFEGAIPARIDDGLVVPGFPVDVFNVVGAGDGFMGGLLFGWLRDLPLAEACRIGNACGALVVSRHGCSPASPTADELAWFLERDRAGGPPDLYRDRELTRLHRATTRRARPARLRILDCDGDPAPGIRACAPLRRSNRWSPMRRSNCANRCPAWASCSIMQKAKTRSIGSDHRSAGSRGASKFRAACR